MRAIEAAAVLGISLSQFENMRRKLKASFVGRGKFHLYTTEEIEIIRRYIANRSEYAEIRKLMGQGAPVIRHHKKKNDCPPA